MLGSHMRKKVCLVAVCYNSFDDTAVLLDSIERAFEKSTGLDLYVVLSDNSTLECPVTLKESSFSFNYSYIKNDNIGYFPAFKKGFDSLAFEGNDFDFVIVSNVDLSVQVDFFNNLISESMGSDVGVLAPNIVSLLSGSSMNPKIIKRPAKSELYKLKRIFSNHLLFNLYSKLSYIKAKFKSKDVKEIAYKDFYAAHGCFMIFTRGYFKNNATINYPRFLFCEELFVAEQVRLNSLKMKYSSRLVINDREHGATSQINSKFIAAEHQKSIDYIIDNFYSS
jgi:GT2 family glycosyltransferase